MLEISGYTYCRNCKRIAKLNYFVNINNKDNCNYFNATIINTVTEKKVSKICASCGGQLEIVDSKIASIISLLNIKGYETVECSGGYENDNEYESPYIIFKNAPARIFNNLPYPWVVDMDVDYYRNLCSTNIFYDKYIENNFKFNQRDLFMWVANLPFIGDPQTSSSDAKMRMFIEYFLDEKYWQINYSKRYSHHSQKNSPYETDTTCDNCDGALCGDCELTKKLEYEFCCPVDKYAEAIELIFGKSHKDAMNIASDDYNHSEVKTPSYYHLKTFFPEFLTNISTLQGFNRDLFERMKSDKMTLLDMENRAYGFHNNDFLHRHFLNQYELFKYIKDKENEEK